MPAQTFGNPFITGETVEDLRRSTQFWFERMVNHLDQVVGLRGTPTFYSDIDANTRRITALGRPMNPTDAERVDFSLRRSTEGGNFDAQGGNIENVRSATNLEQAVNLAQLRNEILTTLASGLATEPFVVVAASASLTAERVLTGTARILITDAGPNSTVTVDAIGAALTRTDDTNVTLTLGGAATTALVNAASLTLGWAGQLAVSRGGTGVATFTSNGVVYGNAASALQVTAQGAANSVLTANAGAPAFSATPTVTSLTTTAAASIGGNVVHTGSNIGFFSAAVAAQQVSGANLTNNAAAGGTDNQIDNWTDLVVYANDAAAIRNAVYQLARKLKQVNDGLRVYGLLT